MWRKEKKILFISFKNNLFYIYTLSFPLCEFLMSLIINLRWKCFYYNVIIIAIVDIGNYLIKKFRLFNFFLPVWRIFFSLLIIDITLALTRKVISLRSKWLCESARRLHFNEVVGSIKRFYDTFYKTLQHA